MFIEINKEIDGDIHDSRYSDNGKKINYLGKIGLVNLFVGPNNSGKSRFLRGLIKSRKFRLTNSNKTLKWENDFFISINDCINNLSNNDVIEFQINSNRSNPKFFNDSHNILFYKSLQPETYRIDLEGLKVLKELFTDAFSKEEFDTESLRKHAKDEYLKIDVAISILSQYGTNEYSWIINSRSIIVNHLTNRNKTKLIKIFTEIKTLLKDFEELEIIFCTPQKTYIPTLRSATTLYSYSKNSAVIVPADREIFKRSIIKNYAFSKDDEKLKIVTGLDFYDSIRMIRNNVKSIRKDFEKFEEFLSKVFFNGEDVDIVAKASENQEGKNIIVHIGGEERDIHHLGDGIQSLIILMYPIFTATEGSWIFIEEPEINLHPGLQRIFLEQLLTNVEFKKKDLKFFITTHSNHFLDLSLNKDSDISIFTFHKIKSEESINYEIKNVLSSDTNSLRILGVRNSSVFISNCTIWVEGICDRKYIKAFLKAFYNQFPKEKRFNEDVDFAFFEYAGSNLSHYIFENNEEELEKIKGQFLSNKIFLVADADEGKEQKHEYYKNQESDIFKYEVLNCKEIENILSKEQIISFLPALIKGIKSEKLETISLNKAHLKNQYLGSYLKKSLKGLSVPKAFTAKSGTLTTYYKNKLADIVSEKMDWDEMTEYAKELTTKIHMFIQKSNN